MVKKERKEGRNAEKISKVEKTRRTETAARKSSALTRPAVAPLCQTMDAEGAGPCNSWSCYFYTLRLKGPPEA